MSNRLTNLIAVGLLSLMFLLAFFSTKEMSATMDELAHIPAGYSYLSQKDFRLNPEHPPLIKDLAAFPLLFLNLNFPEDHPSWTEGVNQQWWFGNQFLYQSGNNPDQILFWARIPMILILLLLGWFLFYWARKIGGNIMAISVLFLFAFSPTFLAHGRLVTTDVGAALGVVLATYFWLKWLKNPSKKNIILAGIIFGLAMLLKFSLVLLVPFFAIITLAYAWLDTHNFKKVLKYIGLAVLVGIIGLIVIWPVYQFHLLNYPLEKQFNDARYTLESNKLKPLVNLTYWMSQKPIFRPYAQYLLGLLMATQRVTGGNTTYFLGQVSATGSWYYFPVVYFLKIPLAFHLLTLIAICCLLLKTKKGINNCLPRLSRSKKANFLLPPSLLFGSWIKNHFPEFSMLVFLAIYWFTSIKGNLNIGVRHLLPVFPFTYILVCLVIKEQFKNIQQPSLKKIAMFLLFAIFGWYILSSGLVFPHYLSYFNELGGGPKDGYKLVTDSNYDWGQDLKRLKNWVEENRIEKIYVDYFGGGDVFYYLGEKYISWPGTKLSSEFPSENYLAVSATLLQGGRGKPVKNFDQPTGYYNWLDNYEPITRVGNSIFIYYID
ncbi:hypothetical protein COX73_01470 [bacterium (Candidatus Gribaldobacteria) CG_4_10_14_0_2_um_filter_36_18]|uniref:Glycosyltransferase RgtA/B/C/D-like domain-containing protein n=1 Tax=bacterium (Candidatus Gribaldobacteria) CG_4_10_14_0_2_um_filter_36_18 TaxID=2014264 RepID=A0A2M7VKC7_9BACT|nr:MAG: hypothetical protein COX73_01470 [bacterium (Candidatus Gribaldobacteria) CG_4_10_14_0_2_um_filter_36_18]